MSDLLTKICGDSCYETGLSVAKVTLPGLALAGGLGTAAYCGHKYRHVLGQQLTNLGHLINGQPSRMEMLKAGLGNYKYLVAAAAVALAVFAIYVVAVTVYLIQDPSFWTFYAVPFFNLSYLITGFPKPQAHWL